MVKNLLLDDTDEVLWSILLDEKLGRCFITNNMYADWYADQSPHHNHHHDDDQHKQQQFQVTGQMDKFSYFRSFLFYCQKVETFIVDE